MKRKAKRKKSEKLQKKIKVERTDLDNEDPGMEVEDFVQDLQFSDED